MDNRPEFYEYTATERLQILGERLRLRQMTCNLENNVVISIHMARTVDDNFLNAIAKDEIENVCREILDWEINIEFHNLERITVRKQSNPINRRVLKFERRDGRFILDTEINS